MRKITAFAVALLFFSGLAFSYHGHEGHSASANQEPMLCHVPAAADEKSGHDHHAMMGHAMTVTNAVSAQDGQQLPPLQPDGSRDTPSHRYSPGDGCSAVNPKAPNKERDGVHPNTVGCKCAKKCVNGNTQEDLSKDDKGVYLCRNACHKDRCTCPDPCKS